MFSVLAKDSKKEKRVRKLNKKYMSILRTILTWNRCYKKESYINHMTKLYTIRISRNSIYIQYTGDVLIYAIFFKIK